MADYFTHFSCLIDVGSPDKSRPGPCPVPGPLRAADQETPMTRRSRASLIERQDAPEGSTLWIHDDEHGDVEAVIHFVLRLAEDLRPHRSLGVPVRADLFPASPRRLRRRRA